MKKVLLAAACVLVLGASLTSCDPDEQKCWKASYDINIGNIQSHVDVYTWASKNQMEAQVANWKTVGYTDIKYKSATKFKTANDCVAQNKL